MPRIYKPGQIVGQYTITAELHRGMMATAYAANGPTGKVFFKQYKSPTITVPWYKNYLDYQKEIRRRIEGGPCQNFCYRFLDAFEVDDCFFQAFEFLDRSDSMQTVLENDRARLGKLGAEPWLLMAKVLTSGVVQLHAAKLVHSDLKPDNVMLIHDQHISMLYRLRIIDMDFSLLTDRKAPWCRERGFFGTNGYLSPEHLRGQEPTTASDVFTLGLMLHELLAGQHPYNRADGGEESVAVFKHTAKPLALRPGLSTHLLNASEVIHTVHRCLAPDAKARPTAKQMLDILNNRTCSSPLLPPAPLNFSQPAPVAGKLILVGVNGEKFRTSQGMLIGRSVLVRFGEESVYTSEPQFRLDRADNGWFVAPIGETKNQTLLNGRHLTVRTRLKTGDVLAVGKESKGVVKLPLQVTVD
ncbi:MAG: FHA domain-containing serine/threonine-protein kinase [Fimbriiglobus sp.]